MSLNYLQCSGGAAICWPRLSLIFCFSQILTWKYWITPTWGLVEIEICQGNKKCYVKEQGTFLKKYLSSYFIPKIKKGSSDETMVWSWSAVWCEDYSVQLWVRRGWCALKSTKLKLAQENRAFSPVQFPITGICNRRLVCHLAFSRKMRLREKLEQSVNYDCSWK